MHGQASLNNSTTNTSVPDRGAADERKQMPQTETPDTGASATPTTASTLTETNTTMEGGDSAKAASSPPTGASEASTAENQGVASDGSIRMTESLRVLEGTATASSTENILDLSAAALDEDPALRKIIADRAQNDIRGPPSPNENTAAEAATAAIDGSAQSVAVGTQSTEKTTSTRISTMTFYNAASPYWREQSILEQQQQQIDQHTDNSGPSQHNTQSDQETAVDSAAIRNSVALPPPPTAAPHEASAVPISKDRIRRSRRAQHVKRNGAFAVAPGGNVARNKTVEYTIFQPSDELQPPPPPNNDGMQNQNGESTHNIHDFEPQQSIRLVEAQLVSNSFCDHASSVEFALFHPPLEEMNLDQNTSVCHRVDEEAAAEEFESERAGAGGILEGDLLGEEGKSGENTSAGSSSIGVELIVHATEPAPDVRKRRKMICCFGLVGGAAILVGIILGIILATRTESPENSFLKPTGRVPLPPTLGDVSTRGVLRCGVSDSPSLFRREPNGTVAGMDVDLCSAIAAAVFGESDKRVEFREASVTDGFRNLDSGAIDVIAGGTTHTMERQVYTAATGTSFAFSVPFLYTGLQVAGKPFYVQCADNNLKHYDECIGLKICVLEDSSHYDILSDIIPAPQLVPTKSKEELFKHFVQGSCNLIAHESHLLAERNIRDAGFTGEYVVGTVMFSKEPLSIVTRDNDPEWSIFVDIVLQALIAAEKHGIKQQNAEEMSQLEMFGIEYEDMLRWAVNSVGNYADVYGRDMASFVPRESVPINSVNNQSTGLLYAHPFGNIDHDREGSPLGPTIASIEARGRLLCSVRYRRPGLAHCDNTTSPSTFQGMEIDICRGLAAGLFAGDTTRVEFVQVASEADGLKELANQHVDVVTGITWELLNYRSAGEWISFSQPYFYKPTDEDSKEDNLGIATWAGDPQWSAFVYWTLAGMIHADERVLTKGLSNQMPVVSVFGNQYDRMFRDVTLMLGSYGTIYNHTMQVVQPRSGRNELNANEFRGGEHYPLPGIVRVVDEYSTR